MRLLLTAALVLSACDGDDDDNPDSGIVDTGPGPDGCFDRPPEGDSGVNTAPCDPGDGTGCTAPRSCVWSLDQDQGGCRCIGDAPKARGEPCSAVLHDCAPGLSCINIEDTPRCHPVCTQSNPVECDPLSDDQLTYLCFPIVRPDQTITRNFGLCVGQQACNPLDDLCPSDQTCTLVTASSNACLPAGNVPLGGDCTQDFCMKGGVCVPLTDQNGNPLGTNCYEPCDLAAPNCSMGSCMDVGISGYGLCL